MLTPRALARLTGVSPDTLRHYERKKLLAPERSANGYRRYADDAVHRVRLIQRALVVGFSLNELSKVFAERERGGAPCRSVRALVGARLADLDARLRELKVLRRELQVLLSDWDAKLAETPPNARAHLLEHLPGRSGLDGVEVRASAKPSPPRPARPAAPRRR